MIEELPDRIPWQVVIPHLDVADEGKVFAEGVADKPIVRQQPPQVRMTLEHDPVEIESLALVPIRRGPDVDDRAQHRALVILAGDFEPQAMIVGDGQEVVDDGETSRRMIVGLGDPLSGIRGAALHAPAESGGGGRRRVPFRSAVAEVVDSGQIHERLEAERFGVPQHSAALHKVGRGNGIAEFPSGRLQSLHASAELGFDCFGERRIF